MNNENDEKKADAEAKADEKPAEAEKPLKASAHITPREVFCGGAARMRAHNAVRAAGGSPREAIAAYCRGNKWLTENARAAGNLPPGH
jgi:hypothetical protein